MEYRQLTNEEISLLESRGCKAEDWDRITVDPDFDASYIRNTSFYGVNVEGYYPSFSQYGTYTQTAISAFLPKATFGYEKGAAPVVNYGDVNQDGGINIADVTMLIDLLLNNGDLVNEADCNQDGVMNIADLTLLIDYMLNGQW